MREGGCFDSTGAVLAGTEYEFGGLVDEVAAYNTVLSADDIRTHYQVGIVPDPTTCAFFALTGIGLLVRRRRRNMRGA